MPFLIILALVIALGTVLFALQNTTRIVISFFGTQFQEPLALVLLITLAIGILVGLLVLSPSIIRRSLKIASQRKQMQELDYELQVKDQAIAAEAQKADGVRARVQDILSAASLLEPTTGLLKGDLLTEAVRFRLRNSSNGAAAMATSVCLYLLEANESSEGAPMDQLQRQQLQRAIAERLRQVSADGNWLYHDGRGQFACLTTGLDTKSANDYGEAIRAAFADQALQLENGTTQPTTISMGGAIAYPSPAIEASAMVDRTYDALEQAKRRGRNRFRLVEAQDG
ncbi:MAG: lipopolysaccharide assembly protein LapA domain-containing protein [Cyanobacteria bacterium J06638_20]